MKYFHIFLFMGLLGILLSGCSQEGARKIATSQVSEDSEGKSHNWMRLRMNGEVFELELADNSTAKELLLIVPDRFTMRDLHQNEKYYDLPQSLPMHEEQVNRVEAGDVMLYGKNTFVIFYQSVTTDYSYTRIGHIRAAEKLADQLGNDEVVVERVD